MKTLSRLQKAIELETNDEKRPQETLDVGLRIERVKTLIDQINQVIEPLSNVKEETMEIQREIQSQLASFAMSVNLKFRPEEITAFQKRPYFIEPVPGKRDNWRLIVPRFIDIGAVGWIDDVLSNDSYNVFLINRYTEWLGEIPEEIKKQLGFKPTLKVELVGDELHGPRNDLDQAWEKYRSLLKAKNEDKIKINPKKAFELIVSLVKDGILPFTPKPIPESDLMERPVDFELRDYQEKAWEKLLQYSNIGVFFPASTGKTFQALYAMSRIKGPHLVVVPTRLLVEQWQDRIEIHTQLKPEEYVVTTYQSAIKKYASPPPPYTEWGLIVIDEVHHLPSNQFSKLALIKRRCTLGLSASPNREDGREEYIFALTGYPVGLGWQYFRQLGIIRSPICHIWLVKNFEAKLTLLENLLQTEKKTLIFSDSIEIGKAIKKRFNIEHIWGETKERLNTLKDEKVVVISRVGDEGVSLPDIERVIEVSWLYGCIPVDQELTGQNSTAIKDDVVYGFDGKRIIRCKGEVFETRFDKVWNIETNVGSFRCTQEHELLTSTGYISAQEAKNVAFALRLPYSSDKNEVTARLVGHLFGDGYLATDKRWKTSYRKGHSGWVKFIAEPEDLDEIKNDLATLSLPFTDRIYGGELRSGLITNMKGVTHLVKGRTYTLNGKSDTYRFFLERGVPSGRRSDVKYNVPDWIMNGQQTVQREFLATLFGSDSNAVEVRSRRANRLRYAFFKKEDLVEDGIHYTNQLRQLLQQSGIESTVPQTRLCSIRKDGCKNIQIEFYINSSQLAKFIENIGFRYARKKEIQAKAFWVYLREKTRLSDRRRDSYNLAIALHQGQVPLNKILSQLRKRGELDGTVKSWLYKNSTPTQSPRWFPEFNTWLNQHVKGELAFIDIENKTIEAPTQCKDIQTLVKNYLVSSGFVIHNSRRQELQRFTRLLHGQTEKVGEHHILMTVDEYLHDRKRLFSVMDRGFKLEIHREGVSEQTISKRLESPSKAVRRTKTEPPQESVLTTPDEGAIAGIFNLPGIKKTMTTLTEPQQRLYKLLLKNDGQWFKKSNLPLVLGYSSINSMRVSVTPSVLILKGLIEERRISGETCYRTNIRARLGVS